MDPACDNDKQTLAVDTVHASLDHLRQWHADYTSADGDEMEVNSSVILDVASDPVDKGFIRYRLEQATAVAQISRGYCNHCHWFFNHWPELGTKSWEHAVGRQCSTEVLKASARKGCKFCSFSMQRLRRRRLLDTFRRIEKRLAILQDGGSASISVSNWGLDSSRQQTQLLWLNFPGKVSKNCNSPCASRTKFESHVLSPLANLYEDPQDPFDLGNKWLEVCSRDHQHCRAPENVDLPTRLVSVANGTAKIVLTEDMHEIPLYATLSYCWGKEDFVKLTPDTLNAWLQNVPYDSLPQTFQDAIRITRQLALDFIWIDALCIMQGEDDHADWLKESGRMKSTYGNSYVNIAAYSSTDVHGGCLTKSAAFNAGFIARVTTTMCGCVRNFHDLDVYERSTSATHLSTRAWTLQEKLLAPRTIYFGKKGLFWECRTEIRSEFLPDGFPEKLGERIVRPEGQPFDWGDIVSAFSKAQLSNGADKLPALSGIARHQHDATGQEYLAGMWNKKLVRQLPWETKGGKLRPDWRAPTWTWTSLDTPSHYWQYWDYDNLARKTYAQVLHACTELAGPDPFGAVSGGTVRLRCTAMIYGHCGQINNDDDKEAASHGSDNQPIVFVGESLRFPIYLDCSEEIYSSEGSTVFLLPLIGGRSGHAFRETVKKDNEERATDDRREMDEGMRGQEAEMERKNNQDTEENKDENEEEDDKEEVVEGEWVDQLMIRGIVVQSSRSTEAMFRRVGWFELRHPDKSDNRPSSKSSYQDFLGVMEEVEGAITNAVELKMPTDLEGHKASCVITLV